MSLFIDAAGWLLKRVVGKVVDKFTSYGIQKVATFDAICQTCKTKKSAIQIPEKDVVQLTCDNCGHNGSVYIENINTMVIHQVQHANIIVSNANIQINDFINKNTIPRLSKSEDISYTPQTESSISNMNFSVDFSDSELVKVVGKNHDSEFPHQIPLGSVWKKGEESGKSTSIPGMPKRTGASFYSNLGAGLYKGIDQKGSYYCIWPTNNFSVIYMQPFKEEIIYFAIDTRY